jgi:hypothetical protein
VFTRVAAGRARVVREVRAAAPLTAELRAPAPARGPWLTAALGLGAAQPALVRWGHRPVAVVVEEHPPDPPSAAAFLTLHRRGPRATVTLLGSDVAPLPGGRPTSRLLARDDAAAGQLAEGLLGLLDGLHGAWSLQLRGLPMGDPVVRALADRLPEAVVANVRSSRLVDELDGSGGRVERGADPAWIDRRLPDLLAREPDARVRRALRLLARVHAAAGELELAVVGRVGDGPVRGALLTLVDGPDRWPWWGWSDVGGLRTEMGAPLVGVTVRGGWRAPQLPVVPLRLPGSRRAPGRRTAPAPH